MLFFYSKGRLTEYALQKENIESHSLKSVQKHWTLYMVAMMLLDVVFLGKLD